jgi:hypothetical protein
MMFSQLKLEPGKLIVITHRNFLDYFVITLAPGIAITVIAITVIANTTGLLKLSGCFRDGSFCDRCLRGAHRAPFHLTWLR